MPPKRLSIMQLHTGQFHKCWTEVVTDSGCFADHPGVDTGCIPPLPPVLECRSRDSVDLPVLSGALMPSPPSFELKTINVFSSRPRALSERMICPTPSSMLLSMAARIGSFSSLTITGVTLYLAINSGFATRFLCTP